MNINLHVDSITNIPSTLCYEPLSSCNVITFRTMSLLLVECYETDLSAKLFIKTTISCLRHRSSLRPLYKINNNNLFGLEYTANARAYKNIQRKIEIVNPLGMIISLLTQVKVESC